MVNYQNGKIYRIDGGGLTYIGSTTNNYLSTRLAGHKCDYNRFLDGKKNYYTSFEILKTDNYRIELLEKFPCDSKDELTAREGYYIRQMVCVNKHIAGRTKKEWHQDNKNELNQKYKQYYQDNKEQLKKRHECECGGKYTHKNKSAHLKTKKHLNYLKDS